MNPQIILFEDRQYKQFFPLTALRPIAALRAGIVPLYKRVERYFPDCPVTITTRDNIAAVTALECRDVPINIIKKDDRDLLFLNARINDFGDIVESLPKIDFPTVFKVKEQIVGWYLPVKELEDLPAVATLQEYSPLLTDKIEFIDFDVKATLFNYCWDIMASIESEITSDFNFFEPRFPVAEGIKVDDGSHWIEMDKIYLGNNVTVQAGALLDASNGPIYISDNVTVESFAAIYGPTYIGPNSLVLQGKVSSSSIGHTCRVGGEVEWSIFQAYVNKYHAGFIGHSYVGPWVNFGAMTTNSDLKNNYSEIRTKLNGKGIASGSTKIGSFIGDHTKFGIGTLLNTGINIGICCNLFGGTLITDKEVKPFSWGSTGSYKSYNVDKIIETARIVSERRNVTFSEAEDKLIRAYNTDSVSDEGIIQIN